MRWRGSLPARIPGGARGLIAAGSAVAAVTAVVMPMSPSAAAGPAPAGQRISHGGLSVVITRDHYGVPSIYSKTLAGMWFGSGWAQAQDRMAQLELTRRAVEGTLSQIFGPSQLGQDETVRTLFYTPAELRAQYRSLPAATRRAIDEFSSGINAYEQSAFAGANAQQRVPVEFFALGQALGLTGPYRPAPWRPIDTVAVGNYLAREFGGGGGSELQNLSFLTYLDAELTAKSDAHPAQDAQAIFNDARWIDDTTAPTTVPSALPLAAVGGRAAAGSRAAGSAVSGSFAMDQAMTLGWLRSRAMSSRIAARWAAAASAPMTPGPKVRAPGSPMFPRLMCRPTAGVSSITSSPCRSA